VWLYDDGDNTPEASEISWIDMISVNSALDDDYPSVVTAVSCYVGCPEESAWGSLGIDLLTKPGFGASVGVIASARSPYGTIDWPNNLGGTDSIIYEFNKNMIKNYQKVGEAFYNAKYFCNYNYGWNHYIENLNQYTYNLFGDPSLTLLGISENYPPEIPNIIGPSRCIINEINTFEITSIDPDDNDLFYYIEYDENQGYWTDEASPSGETIFQDLIWEETGTFNVRVKAKDIYGAESNWASGESSKNKICKYE
jgi:hypothetical protein